MSLFNKIKSVFNSSSDDVPDAQTIYFKNGEMYKVSECIFSKFVRSSFWNHAPDF